jgi:hypothetical protein
MNFALTETFILPLSIPHTCITTAWACKILRDGQNKNELLSNLTENVSDENPCTSQDIHRNDDVDGVEKKRNSKSKKLELVKKITSLRIEVCRCIDTSIYRNNVLLLSTSSTDIAYCFLEHVCRICHKTSPQLRVP